MSSTNKTPNYKLNRWIGTDVPQREDFNNDNTIIDNIIASHISNTTLHTSADEKSNWNNMYNIEVYYGNGSASRTITLGASFSPRWGIVFAASYPPSVVDITNEADYNYFAIVTEQGSMAGITLSDNQLKVLQSSSAVKGTEYRNFNEKGVTYVCVMFK